MIFTGCERFSHEDIADRCLKAGCSIADTLVVELERILALWATHLVQQGCFEPRKGKV